MRFSLPSQQSTFNASLQKRQQWPLPPKPTPPMTSHCSTPVTTLSPSTRKSPISSIISRMSGTLPPHPYRQTPPLPTKGNEQRSSSSSRKSVPASRRSNGSSTWQMTMPPSSTPSLRTHPLALTSTGEKLPGDPCCNRNSRCRHHKTSHRPSDTSTTQSASHSNHCTGYNLQADESDYDDNETPDIADLYDDEVYNNID